MTQAPGGTSAGSPWSSTASTSSRRTSERASRATCSGRGAQRTSRCWRSAMARSSSASASRSGRRRIAGVIGVVLSFALCGVVALAGKRGSAPTMVLSRAAFGVTGNALPSALSWILLVGWETVLVSLSVARDLDRVHRARLGRGHVHQDRRPSSSPLHSWSAPGCSASTSSCGCRPSSPSQPPCSPSASSR